MNLLQKAFEWGREINPSQPLSAGVWSQDLHDLNKFQLSNSDVITYHNYEDEKKHQQCIDSLKKTSSPFNLHRIYGAVAQQHFFLILCLF